MNRIESIEYIFENYRGSQGGYQFAVISDIVKGAEYDKIKFQYDWGYDNCSKNRTYEIEQLDLIIKDMEEY